MDRKEILTIVGFVHYLIYFFVLCEALLSGQDFFFPAVCFFGKQSPVWKVWLSVEPGYYQVQV